MGSAGDSLPNPLDPLGLLGGGSSGSNSSTSSADAGLSSALASASASGSQKTNQQNAQQDQEKKGLMNKILGGGNLPIDTATAAPSAGGTSLPSL